VLFEIIHGIQFMVTRSEQCTTSDAIEDVSTRGLTFVMMMMTMTIGAVPLCSRILVLSEGGGEIDVRWHVGGDDCIGSKLRVK